MIPVASLLWFIVGLFTLANCVIEHVPNNSEAGGTNSCSAGDAVCIADGSFSDTPRQSSNTQEKEWKPFRITSKEKWLSFDSLVENYIKWHEKVMMDEDIPCSMRKVLVFEPSAGLGDSIGALTSGFIYALRAGRLFFINWKPFAWSVTFKHLPFIYNFEEASKMTSDKTGKPIICPEKSDTSSFLTGHVTHSHPIISEAEGFDFHTDYSKLINFFISPSKKVQEVIESVTNRYFNADDENVLLHKVALVMRTGIGEYNQFLSVGDEENFVTCFRHYARNFKIRQEEEWRNSGVTQKTLKFSVLVFSDNEKAKKNAIDALQNDNGDVEISDVISLEDSIQHVMHMTTEESKLKRVRSKLRKTVAEFFLISLCDARFLTHGSLFGRTAAEHSGESEEGNFYISDSQCDGKREKHSYLQCRQPKYPSICELK